MKSILFVFILSFILIVGCGPKDPMNALREVTPEQFSSHIAVLAHDSLEGRGPSSRGDRKATDYIASQMKSLGLEPAGDNGTYIQSVPMVGIKVDPNVSLDLKKGSKSMKLKFIDDFVAYTGVYQPAIDLKDVEVVFVGYGIEAPEQQWDDYKGVDLRGKILLMLNNDPPSDDPKFFGGKARTYYGRWTYKFEIAAKKGAAGAIILHTTESAGYPFQVWQNSWSGEQYDLDVNDDSPRLKLKGATSEEATKKYVAMAGFDLAKLQKDAEQRTFKPVPLGLRLSTSMNVSIKKLQSNNIAGILRGSDANLNKQYVVFSAHYDHFGIGRVIKGDSIYNGALDNAS
ncbi:MAG: M28 family peptidase [Ignavibacteriales bacterium]|nr:M28 family peptidase [Ignavibacteriales bacterium]